VGEGDAGSEMILDGEVGERCCLGGVLCMAATRGVRRLDVMKKGAGDDETRQ